jgi:hypothetical protein
MADQEDTIAIPLEGLQGPTQQDCFSLQLPPHSGPYIIFFDPDTLGEEALMKLGDVNEALLEKGVVCHWIPVVMQEGVPAVGMLAWEAIVEWVGK